MLKTCMTVKIYIWGDRSLSESMMHLLPAKRNILPYKYIKNAYISSGY